MVKFGEYFESMVALKPEWRNAYIDYPSLNSLLSVIKNSVHVVSPTEGSEQSLGRTAPDSPSEVMRTEPLLSLAPQSGHEDEDTFAVTRGRPIPVVTVNRVEDESTPFAVSMPIQGTPPIGGSHRVFGDLYRTTTMDHPSLSRAGTDEYHATYGRSPPLAPSPHNFEERQPPTPPNEFVVTYEPRMSAIGVNAAKEFEDLLIREVEKAVAFANKSFNTFADFFEAHQGKWRAGSVPKRRIKDNLRFLHSEVLHLTQFIETNELAIKTATKKYLKSHPFYIREEVSETQLLPLFTDAGIGTSQLQGAVASLWAQLFMDGDINAARSRILVTSASATQSFRAGLFFALIIAAGLYWLHVRFELQPTHDVMKRTDWVFPIWRLFVTILFAFICWSWVLYHFERRRINYLYVFEFSQTSSMSWMQCLEYSLMMFFFCVLMAVLYVRSELHDQDTACYSTAAGFPGASPYLLPAFFFVLLLSFLLPIRHVFVKTRNSFCRVFWRCMQLPFGDVRFVEFFVADWGTSLVLPAGDLLYFVCFYTAEAQNAFLNKPDNYCLDIQTKHYYPVAMIPYFWRACQTFKMWLKTGKIAHLINHGKYQTFMIFFVVSWAHANVPDNVGLSDTVWVFHFAAQLYAWIWDVLMDWGWIQGRERKMMFKTYRPYIAATIVDFLLRMYFVFCTIYIQPVIGQNYMYLIQATVEVFRRSMWSIFRIENENINNLELYRKIDFVPTVALRDE